MPTARNAPLKMRRKGDNLVITWPHSRRQVRATAYLAISALFVIGFLAAASLPGLTGAALLAPLLIKLLAVTPFIYAAIAVTFNRNQLKMSRNRIEFSSGPLPLFTLRRRVTTIKGLFLPPQNQTDQGGKSAQAIYYFTESGKARLLASNFDTRDQALSAFKELEDAYELPNLGDLKQFYQDQEN